MIKESHNLLKVKYITYNAKFHLSSTLTLSSDSFNAHPLFLLQPRLLRIPCPALRPTVGWATTASRCFGSGSTGRRLGHDATASPSRGERWARGTWLWWTTWIPSKPSWPRRTSVSVLWLTLCLYHTVLLLCPELFLQSIM